MPTTNVIAIVALCRIPGQVAKVAKVASRPKGVVIMIPRNWAGARLMAAPTRIIAVREFSRCSTIVDAVTQSQDGSGDAVKHSGCLLIAIPGTISDISSGHQHVRRREHSNCHCRACNAL